MSFASWFAVATVVASGALVAAAYRLLTRYCDRYAAPTESELDQEFP